jgi:hypothetical protein
MEQVKRLGRLLDQLAQERAQLLIPAYDNARDKIVAQLPGEASFSRSGLDEAADMRVEAATTDGSDTATGPIDPVLAQVDRRSVQSVDFEVRIQFAYIEKDERVKLTLSQAEGVTLAGTSSDPGWIRQVLAQMSEEVDKGAPRWGWIHSRPGRVAFWLVVGLVAAVVFALSMAPHTKAATWLLASTAAFAVAAPAASIAPVRLWLFPRFEITGDGVATGTRRLVFLGSLLLSVMAGVFVNRVS